MWLTQKCLPTLARLKSFLSNYVSFEEISISDQNYEHGIDTQQSGRKATRTLPLPKSGKTWYFEESEALRAGASWPRFPGTSKDTGRKAVRS